MQLWVADGERGLMRGQGGAWRQIGPAGGALCAAGGRVWCAGRRCRCYDQATGAEIYDAPLPPGVCALSAGAGRVYALSAEADSVSALSAATGDLLCCAPAGVYPRGLCAHPQGRYVLAAGGASGEMLLMDSDLGLLKAYRLPGTVCGACFWGRGMAALCAVEAGDALGARLYSVSFRGVLRELLSLPLLPCCLCALPGGGCLAGCCGEIVAVGPDSAIRSRCPAACPLRLTPGRTAALCCEAGEGLFTLPGRRCLLPCPDPLDALALPP